MSDGLRTELLDDDRLRAMNPGSLDTNTRSITIDTPMSVLDPPRPPKASLASGAGEVRRVSKGRNGHGRRRPEHEDVRLPTVAKLIAFGWSDHQIIFQPEWRVPKTPSQA